jgi:hypothetical protein
MKYYLALGMIVVGGCLVVGACASFFLISAPGAFAVHPVALAGGGLVGAVLIWRGVLMRPRVPPSRRLPDTSGENWTSRTGSPKPSFPNKPKDGTGEPAPNSPAPTEPPAVQE